jgi:hypothetical protein
MTSDRKMKSLMGGAALAALLILPSLSGHASEMQLAANTPRHHATPPAPPAAPAASAMTAQPAQSGAQNGNWVRWPTKTYNAGSLKVEDLVGTLTIDVKDSGPMTVEVSGDKNRVGHIDVSQDGNTLDIDGENSDENDSVWDWKNWFNFKDGAQRHTTNLFVRVTIPKGTEVRVEDLVGNANIGDTYGVIHFGAAATTAQIGRVKEAHIDVGGSGKITVGSTQGVDADIAGSGDVTLGPVAGGMKIDIAGSGDISTPRVDGPVHVEIAGSGSVKIADGKADPLHVEIMGAGNFSFGGVANNPHIEAVGSGSVKIKSYTGKLDTEGMANVQIGQQ